MAEQPQAETIFGKKPLKSGRLGNAMPFSMEPAMATQHCGKS
jgi:hypothetical protein